MSYKYMLLDSRGAPVAQGVSEDGPEKNVWQLRIAHGDIKRVLGHEYISLVGTSEQFPAMEGRIVRCRDNLVSVESVRMLGEEVRRNLRMPVRFESFLYPVSGRWRGRMPVLSNDLSCGGVAFFCARKLEVDEVAEIVIPVTAEPLVLRVKILRERPSPEPIPLYAAEFVDKTHDIDSMDALKGLTLTRVGNFEFRDGYLTDGQGNVVYGFITRSNGDDPGTTPGDKPSTDLVPIRLPMKSTDPNSKGDAVYVGVDDQTGANVYPDNDPAATVDGFVDLENISIDKNGKITGTNKDTGDPVVVGYIALGSVENLNGVLHTEGPYYTAGDAAGDIRVGTPGNSVTGNLRNDKITDGNNVVDPDSALAEGSGATLMTGFLEASGTDLATEFANMIIYQRGYQANTRIVTVTDTMLEELVNMKR